MKLKFNIQTVSVTEFGVGRETGDAQGFVAVPVDSDVQTALHEMVEATHKRMQKNTEDPAKYEPSEKHGGTEYLYVPLDDDLAAAVRELHEAVNLPVETKALEVPSDVFCYFTRMSDREGRVLTALRRANLFKGILRSRGRLVRLVNDSLQLIEDRVFKLDSDFDFLIDSENVHILRPSGFEFAGKLQQAILDAMPQNITAIQKDIPFVEFTGIQEYACSHPRAARYLASIRSQKETKNIDKAALKKLCKNNGIHVSESHGKITVSPGHELDFLELLDRRRYEVELVKGQPERFRAGSRRKIHV